MCFLTTFENSKLQIKITFNDDEDTDNFPIPTPPLLITLCIIDDDPPLVPVYKNKVSMIIADIYNTYCYVTNAIKNEFTYLMMNY